MDNSTKRSLDDCVLSPYVKRLRYVTQALLPVTLHGVPITGAHQLTRLVQHVRQRPVRPYWSPASGELFRSLPAFVVGFARLLKAAGYTVAWIDEYNTSKLYHATHEPGEQVTVTVQRPVDNVRYKRRRSGRGKGDEKGRRARRKSGQVDPGVTEAQADGTQLKSRELHAVKRFTTAQGLKACINRDTNACLNFRYIVHYWLEHGTRPVAFCRNS